ncbi:MAG: SGNH/GDSL hydrolase family protein [Desulfosporosinus sp.]|nr:SGNH/GDSL hydrolase family protein [Desulfosporosinus sp.]
MSKNEHKYSCKFMVSGDSISKGVIFDELKSKYVILEGNYINLLQSKLNGIIRNTARFGNTIIKGLSKLKDDVLCNNPDVVFLEYGGNDCDFNWNEVSRDPNADHKPKTDFYIFENKLKETLNFLKNNNIISVVMTLPPLNADRYLKWISKNDPLTETNILKWLGSVTRIYWWQEKYSSSVLKIAEETNTKWIDIRGAFLQYPDFTKYLCLDGIHPNELGHKIIANKIMDFIKSDYAYLIKDTTNSCINPN